MSNNQTKSKESNAGRGGKRPGSGRKAGSATKRTREIADKAAESGVTPLEYMLQILQTEPDPELDAKARLAAQGMRFEAAKAAAPYMHPRLANIEVAGKDGGALVVEIVRFGSNSATP